MSRCVKHQIAVGCLLLSFCCQNFLAAAQKPKAADKKIEIIARFALSNETLAESNVQSTKKDGTITLKYRGTLYEGYFLAVLMQKDEGSQAGIRYKLFRLKVEELNEGDIAVVKAGKKAAAFLGKGDELRLFRPEKTTTSFMKKIPEMVDLVIPVSLFVRKDSRFKLKQDSRNNLKQLAIAIYNYHEAFNRFPPAVINGPDGKPWHSWRVLILPFIGEEALYRQYNRNEPWNGPNNKKLLSKMPDIYRNPVYAKHDKFYTNYSAIVGAGTVFPPNAASTRKNANGFMKWSYDKKTRFRDITDGTSNTIMFGTVGPDNKIPWMKPEDIPLGKKVSKLGSKVSFSTPFTIGLTKSAMFVWCDGSTSLIPKTVNTKTLKNLFLRNDGNVVDRSEMGIRTSIEMNGIEIYRDKDGIKARLIYFKPRGKVFTPELRRGTKKKSPAAKTISKKQLEAWINQLSEGSFRTRRTVSNSLMKAGKQALPALVKGTQRKDAELAKRCFEIIIKSYRGKNETLKSAAKKALRGLEKSSNKSVVQRAKKTLLEGAIATIEKLGGRVTLGKSGKVKYVNLKDTKVTDSDLEHLKRMTSLSGLFLDSTKVTDAGLVHLKGMTKLERLYLSKTKLTDAGLVHLKRMNNLQVLKIQHTKVTYSGVKDFKSALPKCGVIW